MAHIIVVGNEKGGAGKSTVSMHVATTLARMGYKVAGLDLDLRQRSLGRYLENRLGFIAASNLDLPMVSLHELPEIDADTLQPGENIYDLRLSAAISELEPEYDFILIDCPGSHTRLSQVAHSLADTLITPLNDSFVDFDLLAHTDEKGEKIKGPSVYSEMVWNARQLRAQAGLPPIDWIVIRNRVGTQRMVNKEKMERAVTMLAKRIGFLRETNFGITFEVKSKPNPNNLAYTPIALPLHTDLTNQELPPGFQFLHCLANEAKGGGSLFSDGFAVAEDLREADPEAFELLSTVTVPFRFHDDDYDIRSRKQVITLDEDGALKEICFNAHIAGILDIAPDLMPRYYTAYRTFMQMSRDPAYLVTFKLQAGEMVVFDNRRVLHGREAFDPNTGRRHPRGCYVDRGEFESRLRVLSRN